MCLSHSPDLAQVRFCGGTHSHCPLVLLPVKQWPVIGLCIQISIQCCKHSTLQDSHTSPALNPVRQSSGMKCLSSTLRLSCFVWTMMRKGWRHLAICLNVLRLGEGIISMQEINTKIGVMEIVFLSRFQENCTCANSGRQVPSLLAQEPGIKPSSTTPWRVVIKSEHPLGRNITII